MRAWRIDFHATDFYPPYEGIAKRLPANLPNLSFHHGRITKIYHYESSNQWIRTHRKDDVTGAPGQKRHRSSGHQRSDRCCFADTSFQIRYLTWKVPRCGGTGRQIPGSEWTENSDAE